ncbi:hypothetical protein M0534_09960 [Methylonatrum kenyense]|uniref:hypothetical protein n=1 Tax=Methylonatrum kenyense TaxID=455253 RepID=UPI0020BF1144|nr:hypothetical protein [Methylonatrum kenyense]MCK8516645.1 hypothetical protein [Methylonatrum kenyense]
MTHYHCTVEFRDPSGCIRHHILDLDANTNEDAISLAEASLMESPSASNTVRVEQVVCWVEDDEPH